MVTGPDVRPGALRSALPKPVVDAALNEDGERAVARDLHRRVRDLAAGFGGRLRCSLDVVHEQVGPNHRLLRFVHRRAHAEQPAARQRRGAGSAQAGVAVAEENREEFRQLRETALAIDPDEEPSNRLLNLVAQRRARSLLDHIDDLFFEPLNEDEDDGGDPRTDQEIRP